MLDWWINNDLPLEYTNSAMDNAEKIDVLNWWLNSGLELKYSEYSLDTTYYKHIDIFDWWITSGLTSKYSNKFIDEAFAYNRVDILDRWMESGLPIKHSKNSIVKRIGKFDSSCNMSTITWWKNADLPIEYLENIDLNAKKSYARFHDDDDENDDDNSDDDNTYRNELLDIIELLS